MEYSFKELYSIIDGDRGKNYPQSNDFCDEGYCLFLNAGNVTKTGWSFDDVHFITQEKDEKLHNGRLSRGDIVITTRGTVGNVVYYDDSIPFDHVRINSGMVILKNRDEKRLLGAFSYYLLTSPYVQKKISLFCSGSAQPQLPIKDFVKIKVEVPSIDKQQLIVNKVSAYDSLIELNNKRIKLLEQMAENLYKEWFVRFRFPGHETAEFENSIPKGWEICKFSAIVDIMSGGTPNTETAEYYGGNIPFYTPKDSTDCFFAFETITSITDAGLAHCNSKLYPVNTVMITARGTVGNINLISVPMAMNQSCYALKSDVIGSQNYLFFACKREIAKLKKMASGGVFDTIVVKTFDHVQIVLPTKDVVESFDAAINPIMIEIQNLIKQNNNLIKQRDLLLPRLMSGKLEV